MFSPLTPISHLHNEVGARIRANEGVDNSLEYELLSFLPAPLEIIR